VESYECFQAGEAKKKKEPSAAKAITTASTKKKEPEKKKCIRGINGKQKKSLEKELDRRKGREKQKRPEGIGA